MSGKSSKLTSASKWTTKQARSGNIFSSHRKPQLEQRIILDSLKELNALTLLRLLRACFLCATTATSSLGSFLRASKVASSLGSSASPPAAFLTNNEMKKPSRPSSGSVRSRCSAAKQMQDANSEIFTGSGVKLLGCRAHTSFKDGKATTVPLGKWSSKLEPK